MRKIPVALTVTLAALPFIAGSMVALAAQAPNQSPMMSFFVTSEGPGKGANLGGLAGADLHCQMLATAVGAGGKTWRAYLSTQWSCFGAWFGPVGGLFGRILGRRVGLRFGRVRLVIGAVWCSCSVGYCTRLMLVFSWYSVGCTGIGLVSVASCTLQARVDAVLDTGGTGRPLVSVLILAGSLSL